MEGLVAATVITFIIVWAVVILRHEHGHTETLVAGHAVVPGGRQPVLWLGYAAAAAVSAVI
jgi:hypothetical protein